ncbi:hypothetical protein GLOIN_2v1775598 [Rhizophagus irregularis DAOM 181602=DAOM 197198]|uniref:Uncharacterized protein n=2 Tax=Rhizophagus irregularis TaxID=588596 RepID=A0A2P4PZC9_RHIID|nr:hypothetical protein GLOIN_2v1775598 [Rhizophagus irregularis DAOM 181602=DAOM 197198]POG70726.1 hypothetical protein GLOIN_2v1775598 [Rhizophagus irregularis DAOM 181602=DAOM 197198]GBC44859.2 hypothetical protein GLOIN_2v1775598 [Rhizophagus irregularis DAOM 181602=DAOM 197198]|eukprot:XP_025177592.1 hypothetical protein GLOIN_2v1775598 [Rhizophagus irregularis DAOM 181602=DAOM 197198]
MLWFNDSEDDYISPSENTNDNSSISNDEFETAKQYHDNNHKFTLVMERIVALEAENARLQKHLNKEEKQQTVNNVRRKLDDDDISSDNSELPRLKKISKHAKLNQHSFDLSINDERDCPIPKPKVGRKYLDFRKVLNIEKEEYNSYREALRHQVSHNLKGNIKMFKELSEERSYI